MLLNRKENDECDLNAQLLATRLRDYSKQERRRIMHSIDGLLLENPPQQLQKFDTYSQYAPSPTYSSSSSSRAQQSPIQISIPDHTYVLQPKVSGIISSHSGTAAVDTVLSSQDRVTILSQEVIQRPDSNNILDTAFINAISGHPISFNK